MTINHFEIQKISHNITIDRMKAASPADRSIVTFKVHSRSMIARLPAFRIIQAMPPHDAWRFLQAHADSLRGELGDISKGYTRPFFWGPTVTSMLKATRRRLQRVYAVANDLGCHVGQPDAAEVAL